MALSEPGMRGGRFTLVFMVLNVILVRIFTIYRVGRKIIQIHKTRPPCRILLGGARFLGWPVLKI